MQASKGMVNKNTKVSKGRKALLLSSAAVMAGAAFAPTHAMAQVATPSNSWDYDTVLDGNVSKDVSTAGLTNITVDGGNGFVEGNADIYTGHTVNVTGDSGATFAYKDNRDNIETTLNGNLNSNMKIVIIDRDGLFFADGSVVDVQSLVATTGDVSVADIMNGGDLTITNLEGSGSIIQNGQITVEEGGLVALVSPFVVNNGVIDAKLASVNFGAGETVTLDLYGDGLLELAVEGELSDALITNNGEINAEGGLVKITAKAAKGTVDNIINNTGIITASSATVDGGKIILDGGDKGTVNNGGQISTSAGGEILVSAERFEQDGASIPVPLFKPALILGPSIESNGGDITISTSGDVDILAGHIDADGGDIVIDNGGVFTSIAEAVKTTGTGTIALNQNVGGNIQNAVDALYNTGSGTNTINVGAGVYAQSVHVNEDNTILNGANAGNAVDAPRGAETTLVPASNYYGIYITAENVKVDGFEIEGGASGVRVNGGDNAVITNNIIRNQYHASADGTSFGGYATGDGIFIQSASDVLVEGNLIGGMNDDGIHAVNVNNFSARNNYIVDDGVTGDEGIAIAYATGTTRIYGNQIVGARRDGIQVYGNAGETQIVGNYIVQSGRSGINIVNDEGNTYMNQNDIGYSKYGIDVVNAEQVLIVDSFIHNTETGINAGQVDRISMLSNDIFDSNNGVVLSGVKDSYFLGNTIDVLEKGVHIAGGLINSNVQMYYNTIRSFGTGVSLDGAMLGASEFSSKYDTVLAADDAYHFEGFLSEGDININNFWIKAGGDAINVTNTDIIPGTNVSVKNGVIVYALEDGVDVSGVESADIEGNLILGAADNGVKIDTVSGTVDVNKNYIVNTGFAGVKVSNVEGTTTINKNAIGFNQYGVEIEDNGLTNISNNFIHNSEVGVKVSSTSKANIRSNEIFDVLTGVELSDTDAWLHSNVIDALERGVYLAGGLNGKDVSMYANTIRAGQEGILLDGGMWNGANLNITLLNSISSGADGVRVVGELDNGTVTVAQNQFYTGGDGVHIENQGGYGNVAAAVALNNFQYTGGDGVDISGIDDVKVLDNYIQYAQGYGARVEDFFTADISGNLIDSANYGGILSRYGAISNISNNIVTNAGYDGIETSYTGYTTVEGNVVDESENDGISGYGNGFAAVVSNEVSNSGNDGIHFIGETFLALRDTSGLGAALAVPSSTVIIDGNTVTNSGGDGVETWDVNQLEITNNDVSDSMYNGVLVAGAFNGDVLFEGNILTDNGQETGSAHARFESGDIDLSNLANPNIITNTTNLPAIGLQFDDVYGGDSFEGTDELSAKLGFGNGLRIVNETIGSTEFNGFTNAGNFYVRIEDGAILDPVTNAPIVIDGTDASFDGVIPGAFAGEILPVATLQFIEDRLYDADDAVVNGRGQIFVGSFAAGQTIDDIQDFFRNIQQGQNFDGGANVRIDGLPLVNLPDAIDGNLNNLEPAAGDEEGEDVANIEPAAGGEGSQNAGCVGDVVSSLGAGSVNYNFGGSFEDTIAAQANCQNSEL